MIFSHSRDGETPSYSLVNMVQLCPLHNGDQVLKSKFFPLILGIQLLNGMICSSSIYTIFHSICIQLNSRILNFRIIAFYVIS